MIYLLQALLLGLTVLEAWWHSRLIKQNRPIRHGWWAAAYGGLCLIAAWSVGEISPPFFKLTLFATACAAGHLVVFNIALNRFRGLPWTYISKTSTSLVDQMELRLVGTRAWLVELFATLVFITLQFFI